ncbi:MULTISPECIES: molybdopterin cofactor-binding domain-containing protein [unclassified Iodidimonas]|jgi:CO/xanthine dehydrogenase Mo-binding subunit|uniref:xanthine dehydrogenase family protein molybdopterin-binding subunit n=1 Tax=unclassified Iodidimonas TaxID=2626145 RepID=UPI0024824B5B|nr:MULTISPECIES: molybdopterin cofactor-binding domain-containing protein [unclassified Iodidimonas]
MADLSTRIMQSGATRRQFLVGSVAGGLMMAFAARAPVLGAAKTLGAGAYAPSIWVQLGPDGRILVNIAKAEMGQHVGTALARVVAEELEADWADVEIVHVDSDPKWGYMVTGGSWSVHTTFDQLSRAGAAGRIAMIEAGARLLDMPVDQCIARQSMVMCKDQKISYAKIVAAGAVDRSFSDEELAALSLKPASERRILGTTGTALDIPEKTTGAARYGIDAAVDGMVYARPVLPPTRYGSVIQSVDDGAAQKIPGYLETIRIDDPSGTCQGWLAVTATSTHAANRAVDALKVTWKPGPNAKMDEQALLDEGARLVNDPQSGALWVREGEVDQAFARAASVVDSTYRTHSVLHFQLEPVNALAFEKDGHWHIHTGNQWQSLILPVVAKALAVTEDQITLHQYYLGGGFGRRLYGDYIIPAALTAKALGKPVKMIFTRADDTGFDCARSPSVQKVRTALDETGKPIAYDHAAAAGWPTYSMAPGFLAEKIEGGGKVDSFSISGADHWYSIENQRVRAIRNDLVQESFLPGWLRSVGPGWTGWAVEQHMDEVAHAAGVDPVAFRLSLLDGKGRNAGDSPANMGGALRLKAVLERAAEKAGWADRGSLPEGEGMGVATCFGQERAMPTWVACIAHVAVDKKSGTVRVKRLLSIVDAGTIVHPDGALAQMEGSSLWGLSMALYEGTALKDGMMADRNLDRYTPLRMDQVPELDIEFIENDHMPSGLGEPGVIVVAPAIANAIFAATGVRLRDLPMRAADLKSALAG